MKDTSEIKIAAGVLTIYGISILGYLTWAITNSGFSQPLQLGLNGGIGLAFIIGGIGSFKKKIWGLYVTAASIIGTILLAVATNLIPGGVLPVIFMIAILWDIYKHREIMG